MDELESDADEVAITEAKRLVAASSLEAAKKVFSLINGYAEGAISFKDKNAKLRKPSPGMQRFMSETHLQKGR